MHESSVLTPPSTLPFPNFWKWLTSHPNCILRAGTPDAVIYDDEDYHWHFANEETGTLVIQVLRGKRTLGEIFIDAEEITYVETVSSEVEGEFVFQLVSETERGGSRLFFFVLVHGFETDEGDFTAAHVH